MQMGDISYTQYTIARRTKNDEEETDAKHIFFDFACWGWWDFDGRLSKIHTKEAAHLPANCFFNNNDDCVSDI